MKQVATLGFLAAVITAVALAQSETAVVFGVIKDPTSAAIAGAHVRLRNEATGTARELQSNDNGLFYFTSLAPGSYELSVEAAGFKQYRDSHVRIQVAQVGRIDILMEIGTTEEFLDVEGSISVINSGNASEGAVVTSEKLPSLPLNGRQFCSWRCWCPTSTRAAARCSRTSFGKARTTSAASALPETGPATRISCWTAP